MSNVGIINNIDCKKMENLWINSTKNTEIFSIYRDTSFWKWRYLDNPSFKNNERYIFFGNYNIGVLVFRKEKYLNGNVVRIVEIIPYNNLIWNGKEDETFINLIIHFCNWCFDKKIILIDFSCTHKNVINQLEKIGFKNCNIKPIFSKLSEFKTNKHKLKKAINNIDSDNYIKINLNNTTHIIKINYINDVNLDSDLLYYKTNNLWLDVSDTYEIHNFENAKLSFGNYSFDNSDILVTNNFNDPTNNFYDQNYILYLDKNININVDNIYETKTTSVGDKPTGVH